MPREIEARLLIVREGYAAYLIGEIFDPTFLNFLIVEEILFARNLGNAGGFPYPKRRPTRGWCREHDFLRHHPERRHDRQIDIGECESGCACALRFRLPFTCARRITEYALNFAA